MDKHENANSEEDIQHPLERDAVPVCPNCLEPCGPLDYYCPHCGSNEALNPLASYMPFVDLRFRIGMVGKLWRKTWHKETPLLDRAIYIGLFVLFFPLLLLVGIPCLIFEIFGSKQAPPVAPQDSD